MVKNKLLIMSGCPGSGKSTYAKKYLSSAKYVSRDEIRFSIVSENEKYFSKENEVFKKFIKEINDGLREHVDVVADATHLNKQSRYKLFRNLNINKENTQIELFCMHVPLETCLERNEKRRGTRSYVPENALKRMHSSYQLPYGDEGILYDTEYIVSPYGEEGVVEYIYKRKDKTNGLFYVGCSYRT